MKGVSPFRACHESIVRSLQGRGLCLSALVSASLLSLACSPKAVADQCEFEDQWKAVEHFVFKSDGETVSKPDFSNDRSFDIAFFANDQLVTAKDSFGPLFVAAGILGADTTKKYFVSSVGELSNQFDLIVATQNDLSAHEIEGLHFSKVWEIEGCGVFRHSENGTTLSLIDSSFQTANVLSDAQYCYVRSYLFAIGLEGALTNSVNTTANCLKSICTPAAGLLFAAHTLAKEYVVNGMTRDDMRSAFLDANCKATD